MLFNVFINDMLDGQEERSGVEVPTGKQPGGFHSSIKVGGALFADDAVGLAPTIEGAAAYCDRITK